MNCHTNRATMTTSIISRFASTNQFSQTPSIRVTFFLRLSFISNWCQFLWWVSLTGAVLVISVPRDDTHEADGRQYRYHALKSVKGASVLTKWPISRKRQQNPGHIHCCLNLFFAASQRCALPRRPGCGLSTRRLIYFVQPTWLTPSTRPKPFFFSFFSCHY